ncbi:DUF4232 domain-containing protein [Dactylosporangium sp. CS-047395]|uniref:DUF4232 domain-containing protein n=1 Tax=Dactylosporangium sp. CS-047395 TaxID=3239936 RepID=UPI003D8C2C39
MTEPNVDEHLDRHLLGLARHAERAVAPPPVADIRRRAHRRSATQRASVAVLALAVLGTGAALALRNSPDPEPPLPAQSVSPTPAPPPSAAPATTGPQSPPASASSATGTTGAATVPCRTKTGLRVSAGTTAADRGHYSQVIVFINAGTAPCRMRGYPGVDAMNARGEPLAEARRTLSGYLAGPGSIATVTIPVGKSATATVEAFAYESASPACLPFASLLVIPPDDTESTVVPWSGPGCEGLEVHPVTPAQ